MEKFMQKQTVPRSITELREHFDLEEATTAFLNGSLERWLSANYYEKEAGQVSRLDQTDNPETRRKLCAILGVDPAAAGALTPKQTADLSRRRAFLEQYTQDAQLLAHAGETALDQADLAALLDEDAKTIWLCGGPFTVPIQKSGCRYIGVGSPRVEGPFTQEQYRKAGITFHGVILPAQGDEEMREAAECAAAANGYDPFAETHTPLAAEVHRALKCGQKDLWLRIEDVPCEKGCAIYRSRQQAETAARELVDFLYDQANDRFIPGRELCLAGRMAAEYARFVQGRTEVLIERLSSLCGPETGRQSNFQQLCQLLQGCEDALRTDLERELTESADYY